MKSTLEALDAALMEWVTISMVCPLALIFENKAKSSSLLEESRAPVGSSARISLGFVIRALATAHLCF